MLEIIAAILIAFLSMFIPGILLAAVLLKKTELHPFEIVVIGFIFGMIAPATLTWLEAYLDSYIHFFSFSLTLFEINALILTIIGAALSYQQGILKDFNKFITEFLTEKNKPQTSMIAEQQTEHKSEEHTEHVIHESKNKNTWWVWAVLLTLMLLTFYTRIEGISTAPKFFEFDPYFDMFATFTILTNGHQFLNDTSAWPLIAQGTNHRIEPVVPYLEAYWYSLINSLKYHYTQLHTSLMSYVGSVYPPITAALLVFVIFALLYHEYNEYIALIGAALTTTMPVLLTTFIAGEQLVEPWGIMTLFFFFYAYTLAIRDIKNKRLAILAGIAFASTFLGAHYYTVTTGVLVLYILAQGIIDVLRDDITTDFYKMNAIVIATFAVLFILFTIYNTTLEARVPKVFGVPITLSGPILSLALIAVLDYVPKIMKQRNIIFKELNLQTKVAWLAFIGVVSVVAILFTPVGNPIKGYLELSARFTTPSKALFMTVQEYIPTGLFYNFGAQGFGPIGANTFGLPMLVWFVSLTSLILIGVSIVFRRSRVGILYMAIALPLMFAGFSEVKYLPHFGVAYILLFCIILGELLFLSQNKYKLVIKKRHEAEAEMRLKPSVYSEHRLLFESILVVSGFFIFGIFALLAATVYLIGAKYFLNHTYSRNDTYLIALSVILFLFSFSSRGFVYGENSTMIQALGAAYVNFKNPSQTCSTLNNANNGLGYSIYCNLIPSYWLNSMKWIRENVGPYAPRVLSWWDYGDWINWFGNTNAVLRGDNAYASEDYATAAHFVLGSKYNYTPQALAGFMNDNQTKYVLFDQDLIAKWQALDFLACVRINATSRAFAIAQARAQNLTSPYVLGTSNCEIKHDPQYALVPLQALVPINSSTQQSINNYCTISGASNIYIRAYLVIGPNLSNNTVCVSSVPDKNGVLSVYNESGTKLNAVIQSSYFLGVINVNTPPRPQPFVQFLMIYTPNGPNNTVTNAPSDFYNSNFYKGFFYGQLPGFTQVYPQNTTGMNLVNASYPVRILAINNFTGSLPPIVKKPTWISNNYSMPGFGT